MYRYATKLNTVIVGGAAKLFTAFIKDHNPQSIITYADLRYFTGDIYLKLNFKFIQNTPPNYFYFLTNKLLLESRVQYQKHKLKSQLLNISEFNLYPFSLEKTFTL